MKAPQKGFSWVLRVHFKKRNNRRVNVMNLKEIICAAILILPVAALGGQAEDEMYGITKKTSSNFCFITIQNDSAKSDGLNHLKISPSSVCECISIEAANAMQANPHYHAYLRNLIRSANIQQGQPPSFEYSPDQDAAVVEYTKVFNNSWVNCVTRLKKS